MSWYSDGEPFDEYDPPYCERCRRTDVSYEVCKRCVRTHNEQDEEDEEEEEDGDEDMAKVTLTVPIEIDTNQIIDFLKQNDVVAVVRCSKCAYWDRDTIRYQCNDFRSWNEAECQMLAERDGYNEINRYTEADDYCSYGERKDG